MDADHKRHTERVAGTQRPLYLFHMGRKPQADYDRKIARLDAELALLEGLDHPTLQDTGHALFS